MSDVWIKGKRGRTVERFDSDVDPLDEPACVELLRRRARVLKERPETLELYILAGRHKRTYRT